MNPSKTALKGRSNRLTKYDVVMFVCVDQSLVRLLVHSVFSTKERRPFLRSEEIRNEIYAYMAGILKNLECHPIKIGGVEDHVHILSSLSKNIAFCELILGLRRSISVALSGRARDDGPTQG